MKRTLLLLTLVFCSLITKGQVVNFDQLNSSAGSGKAINWTTSTFGSGFGHRIINVDPGELTTLNFQARHNSLTWKDAFVISSTGNVGIGLANPQHPLHISFLAGQRSRFQYGTSHMDIVDYPTGSFDYSNSIGIWASGKDALVMSGEGSNIRLVTNTTAGISVERMRVTANGNIGIGTKNPQYLLAVNGIIGAKEVNVTTAGWADYVFKSNYQLKPLSEVEEFISKNGHLPNVPSEKTVLEKGVNLLEMNIKLLEKVEELTLYLIEQQKQIDFLKGEILISKGIK